MPDVVCANAAAARLYEAKVAEAVWDAYVDAGCFVEGRWEFASFDRSDPDDYAEVKVDAEILLKDGNERQLGIVMAAVAGHPCVKATDVLTYVPEGQKKFIRILGGLLDVPVADAGRVPGGSRYDFRFLTPADKKLAYSGKFVVIGEDVISTLGSVAGMRRLFLPGQDVHSVGQLLRGMVNPAYQKGLADHYLVHREIPLKITAADFTKQFGFAPLPAA